MKYRLVSIAPDTSLTDSGGWLISTTAGSIVVAGGTITATAWTGTIQPITTSPRGGGVVDNETYEWHLTVDSMTEGSSTIDFTFGVGPSHWSEADGTGIFSGIQQITSTSKPMLITVAVDVATFVISDWRVLRRRLMFGPANRN